MLSLSRVSFAYRNGPQILDDASLNVERGEIVALVGPSGSGKSTVLGLAGLLVRPDSGSIMIDGHRVRGRGTARQRILRSDVSWIFQGEKLLSGRSVIDNVAIAALARGTPYRNALETGQALLAEVGLSDRARDAVDGLSGGEAQRVCVARALSGSPKIVLADEPTGQLDVDNTVVVLESLRRISTNAATLIATHDEEVARRCDRVVRLQLASFLE